MEESEQCKQLIPFKDITIMPKQQEAPKQERMQIKIHVNDTDLNSFKVI